MFTSMLVKIIDCTEYSEKELKGLFLILYFQRMVRNLLQSDLLPTIRFVFGIGDKKKYS